MGPDAYHHRESEEIASHIAEANRSRASAPEPGERGSLTICTGCPGILIAEYPGWQVCLGWLDQRVQDPSAALVVLIEWLGSLPPVGDRCAEGEVRMRRRKLIFPDSSQSMTGGQTILTPVVKALWVTHTLMSVVLFHMDSMGT